MLTSSIVKCDINNSLIIMSYDTLCYRLDGSVHERQLKDYSILTTSISPSFWCFVLVNGVNDKLC